jgi:hypothetical protein
MTTDGKNIVFKWDGYFKPTPALLRKVGDSFLGAMPVLQVAVIATSWSQPVKDGWIIGIAITCTIAKFVSNFFTTEEPQEPQNNP